MALNFPDSPSNGQTVTLGGKTYAYNSTKGVWSLQAAVDVAGVTNLIDSAYVAARVATVNLSAYAGDILPDADSSRDLGSPSKKWKSLHLSSNTLFLGDSGSISAGAGGSIEMGSLKIGTGTSAVELTASADGKLATKGTDASGNTESAASESGAASSVADMAGLIALTGMTTGQTALVTGLNKIFMYTGTAWYLIATMTNASPTDITGVASTYALADDGTATVITAVSTDPEGFTLTWSYAVTSGALGSIATVAQADNVFTITPSTVEANAGSFGITFSVTDNATGAVNAVSAFSLSFGTWDYPTYQARLAPPSADTATHDGGSYFRLNIGNFTDVSADGNTVVASTKKRYGTTGNYSFGGVYIWTRSGTTWTVEATLQPTKAGAGDQTGSTSYTFGYGNDACISDDGNTVAFSSRSVLTDHETHVYTRSGTTWTLEQIIIPTGQINDPRAMYASAISGDGNTLAIGGYDSNSNAYVGGTGAIFVYTKSGTTWTLQQVLQASDRQGQTQLGYACELSTDGNYLIGGALRDPDAGDPNNHRGAAYIFNRSGSTWTQQAKLKPSNLTSAANFGQFVDMSSNGDYVVISAPQDFAPNNHAGSIYIYHRSGSTWTLQSGIDNPRGTQNDQFGLSVTMSGAGDIVITSAKDVGGSVNYGGRMWFYKRVGSTWSLFNANGSSGYRAAAGAVNVPNVWPQDGSISKDGSTVILSCSNYDGYSTNEGGIWSLKVGNS